MNRTDTNLPPPKKKKYLFICHKKNLGKRGRQRYDHSAGVYCISSFMWMIQNLSPLKKISQSCLSCHLLFVTLIHSSLHIIFGWCDSSLIIFSHYRFILDLHYCDYHFDSLQAVLLLVTAVYPHAKEIDITMEKWTHSDRDANDMIWGWDNKKGRIFVKKGNF